MCHLLKYVLLAIGLTGTTSSFSQTYTPTAANQEARQAFQDNKFGMFIHWGASSVLGAGEWVMNNRTSM